MDIFEDFFSLDFSGLTNITVGENFSFTLYCLIFGVVIAIIAVTFIKMYFGSFIRKLIKNECTSKENAKTLSQLGCSKKLLLRLALREGRVLYNTANSVLKDEYTEKMKSFSDAKDKKSLRKTKFKPNFKTDRYYIDEGKKDVLTDRFSVGNFGVLSALISIVVSVIVGFAVIKLMPTFLRIIDFFIGVIKA